MPNNMRASADAASRPQNEGSESPTNEWNDPQTSVIRRACDACRTRKIRCDRNSPCAYCLHAKISCTHSPKPKEKRTRILLSAQYEKKIDVIDVRLEKMTALLQEIQTTCKAPNHESSKLKATLGSSSEPPISRSSSAHFGQVTMTASDTPVVEGESSLAAHSAFANEFIQKAVRHVYVQDHVGLEMQQNLASLPDVANSLKQHNCVTDVSYPLARPTPMPSFRDNELPPLESTISLIRATKVISGDMIPMMYQFSPLENFSELCFHIYFSENYSQADFITMNIGLLHLYLEYMSRTPEKEAEAFRFVEMSRSNVETALANLPLHLPATISMIGALFLGSCHAIEISKPSLAWTLISKASELCQTLGYHQDVSMRNDDTKTIQRKRFLFWNVYTIEKSLSLRLGRTSTILDCNVTVSTPTMEDFHPNPLSPHVSLWVMTAKCQGAVYELLFSPNSITQPNYVRESRVQTLANALSEIRSKQYGMSEQMVSYMIEKLGKPMSKFLFMRNDILYFSLLTLVYRANSSPSETPAIFVPKCVEFARATLERHQDLMRFIENNHSMYYFSYVQWTLLFCPFIPFIVIFCQVINAKDKRDLALLQSFVASIDCAPAVTDAAGNMYRFFRALYSVAHRYTEFQNSAAQAGQTKARSELNSCLSSLGFTNLDVDFGPQQEPNLSQGHPGVPELMLDMDVMSSHMNGTQEINPIWMNNPGQLEDWLNNDDTVMDFIGQTLMTST